MEVKKQQLELDMEQLTGSKLGKEDDQAVYCHPAYLALRKPLSLCLPCEFCEVVTVSSLFPVPSVLPGVY